MTQPHRGFTTRVLFVCGAAAVMLVTLFGLAYMGGAFHLSAADYHIDAVMPSVSSLIPGARVTMAGAQVGVVGSVARTGNGALVQLNITDRSVTPIPASTRVSLREVTAIGENYVALSPGDSGRKLPSGAVLPMTQANQYVDVDQLLSTLQGSTTQRARQLIEGLGAAVAGRGQDLNATIAGTNRTFTPLANVVQTLYRDRTHVDQLVSELGDIATAAGERGASVIALAHSGLQAFSAIAAQDDRLRATLDQLPPTLSQVRTSAETLGAVTNTAAPVLENLATTLHSLAPAVAALKPAADTGRAIVDQLAPTAPKLQQTLSDARALSKPAIVTLPQLTDALCQVNPILRYIIPNPASSAPSYLDDVISLIQTFGSASNAYDNIGHVVRITPVLGNLDNTINGLPPSVSQATYQLLHAGILQNTTALTWNPYPKPGQAGTEHADAANNGVLGPSQLRAKTGYVYPHIVSDCGGNG